MEKNTQGQRQMSAVAGWYSHGVIAKERANVTEPNRAAARDVPSVV